PAHSIIVLGACAIVFAFIYIVGAFLFGALTPEDQDAIYKHARRLSRKFAFVEAPKPTKIDDRGSMIDDRVIASKAIHDPRSTILPFSPQNIKRAPSCSSYSARRARRESAANCRSTKACSRIGRSGS